jgi:hypothetical protein
MARRRTPGLVNPVRGSLMRHAPPVVAAPVPRAHASAHTVACTAPAAPSRCPVIDLVEETHRCPSAQRNGNLSPMNVRFARPLGLSLLLCCCGALRASSPHADSPLPAVSTPSANRSAGSARPQPAPPLAPVAASVSAVAFAPASVSSPPVYPPALRPAGADPNRFEFVAALCASAIKHDKGRLLVGCRDCPPFDASSATPDGRVVVDPDPFFALELVVRGSFSRPGADQAALVFEGCEPHSANWGGSLLVERSGPSWKAVQYASGYHPRACKVYRRNDGRDILVCRHSDVHQSTATDTISTFDFSLATPDDPEKGWEQVFTSLNNASSVCMGVSPDGVTEDRVESFELRDVNADGKVDLAIQVQRAHVDYSKALETRIHKQCEKALQSDPHSFPTIRSSTFLPAPVRSLLEFVHDGTRFVATPATRARI